MNGNKDNVRITKFYDNVLQYYVVKKPTITETKNDRPH